MLHGYSETEFDWFFFPLGTLGLSCSGSTVQ